jgi:hypothetical protein
MTSARKREGSAASRPDLGLTMNRLVWAKTTAQFRTGSVGRRSGGCRSQLDG